MLASTILPYLTVLALSSLVHAHPGEPHHEPTRDEQAALHRRREAARSCDHVVARYTNERRAARGIDGRKRSIGERASGCVVTPEIEEGPYYIRDELVRSNVREDQLGFNVTLDIQLLDLSTCEPLTGAFVEIWGANYEGVYAGYSSNSDGSLTTDTSSFLRGGNVVDTNGNLTLETLYPGHYSGRTAHIHVMVHTNYTINANGTIASGLGSLIHVGQFFFPTELNAEVFATSPYTNDTGTITTNDEDRLVQAEIAADYPPYLQVDYLGDSPSDGMIMYSAVVVDSSASYSVNNQNVAETFTYSTASTAASETSSETSSISASSASVATTSTASGRTVEAAEATSSTSTATAASSTSTAASSGTRKLVATFAGGFMALLIIPFAML